MIARTWCPVFCYHYSLSKQDSNTLIRGMVMRTKNMHGILFFIWDGGQIEKKNHNGLNSILRE